MTSFRSSVYRPGDEHTDHVMGRPLSDAKVRNFMNGNVNTLPLQNTVRMTVNYINNTPTYKLVVDGCLDMNVTAKCIFQLADRIDGEGGGNTDVVMDPKNAIIVSKRCNHVSILQGVLMDRFDTECHHEDRSEQNERSSPYRQTEENRFAIETNSSSVNEYTPVSSSSSSSSSLKRGLTPELICHLVRIRLLHPYIYRCGLHEMVHEVQDWIVPGSTSGP